MVEASYRFAVLSQHVQAHIASQCQSQDSKQVVLVTGSFYLTRQILLYVLISLLSKQSGFPFNILLTEKSLSFVLTLI